LHGDLEQALELLGGVTRTRGGRGRP
jgi:hypothetical protein